jgi:predicted HicB family RNase H-like nuclease
MTQMKADPIKKNIKVSPSVHRRLKAAAKKQGMKIEALADASILAGLQLAASRQGFNN